VRLTDRAVRSAASEDPPSSTAAFTLVEMLLAILILGVVLSATASSLIGFTKASVVNERRVEATALMQRLHEELQAIPWEDAGIYDDEIDMLITADIGVDVSSDPSVEPHGFGTPSAPIVTLEAESHVGCPTDEPKCGRLTTVPVPFRDDYKIDDIEYEVYTIVTEIERAASSSPKVRRFTTIVRWEILGTGYEQVFESERAPTANEDGLNVIPLVLQFLAEPGLAPVEASTPPADPAVAYVPHNTIVAPISLSARFNVDVTDVVVSYVALDGNDVDDEFEQEMVEGPVGYSLQLDADTIRVLEAETELLFRVEAMYGTIPVSEVRAIALVPQADLGTMPVVSNVIATTSNVVPTRLTIGRNGQDRDRLCDTLTITASVNGLYDSSEGLGSALAIFNVSTSSGTPMQRPASITPSVTVPVSLQLTAGQVSPWTRAQQEQFNVVATNPDGGRSLLVSSGLVDVAYVTTANGQCPK
jgi:prepilin-type N-terminal cleavage/methylation domain-containing protein